MDLQLHEFKTIWKRTALGAIFALGFGFGSACLLDRLRAYAAGADHHGTFPAQAGHRRSRAGLL